MKARATFTIGCMPIIMILLFNFTIGGLALDYILGYFGKNIPFIADALIGTFLGELTIPVALIMWLLQLVGVM